MILGNLRMGFATNSSATHSIIIVKDPSKVVEKYSSGNFGRETFVLKETKSKLDYLAGVLFSSYSETMGEVLSALLVKDYIKDRASDDLSFVMYNPGIPSPLTRDSQSLEEEFVSELKEFISNDKIVIVGMDDCVPEEEDPLLNLGTEYEEVKLPDSYNSVWAKKQKDGWWTLFSKRFGDKVTINFNREAPPLLKNRTPDLVDLKITDYCETGCAYCYQDSNKYGKHATFNTIFSIVDALDDLDVFEIALGGGEPTKHPQFIEILEVINNFFIVPNFSTKNLEWLSSPAIVCAVDKYVGKVGFSCSSLEDLRALIYYVNKSGLKTDKITMHYVLGSCPMDELLSMIRLLPNTGFDLLLLGYKELGRGINFKPHDNSGIWSELSRYAVSTGIDTCIAKRYPEEIKKLRVPEYMYHSEEGKVSMYIDAVELKVSKSSYEPNPNDYKEIFISSGESFLGNNNLFLSKNLQDIFNGF